MSRAPRSVNSRVVLRDPGSSRPPVGPNPGTGRIGRRWSDATARLRRISPIAQSPAAPHKCPQAYGPAGAEPSATAFETRPRRFLRHPRAGRPRDRRPARPPVDDRRPVRRDPRAGRDRRGDGRRRTDAEAARHPTRHLHRHGQGAGVEGTGRGDRRRRGHASTTTCRRPRPATWRRRSASRCSTAAS